MPDETLQESDPVADEAADAMVDVFKRRWGIYAPPGDIVAEALEAASAVYEAAREATVQDTLNKTGFAGMDITDDGVRMNIVYAHDFAKAVVEAFDDLCRVRGATNYVEWESTVLDPATRDALEAGADEIPPHRRYRFIVVKPGKKSPHELRVEADARVAALTAELAAVRAAGVDPRMLRWCDWAGCWRSYEALRGPVGDPGWMRHRHPDVLLCPTHDQAGHRPSFDDWTRGDDSLTARCECGESAVVRPPNHFAVIEWWTTHITGLPAEVCDNEH
jgi:hypothetical protein